MILFSCIPQKILSGKRHIGHLRFSYVDWTYLVANQFWNPYYSQWIPHFQLGGSCLGFKFPTISTRLPDQVSPPSQMLWKCMVWYLKGLQTKSQASPWRFWMPKMPKGNSGSFQTFFFVGDCFNWCDALNFSVSISWFWIHSNNTHIFLWMGIIARKFTQTDPSVI